MRNVEEEGFGNSKCVQILCSNLRCDVMICDVEGGLTFTAAFAKPPGLNPAKIVGVGSLPGTKVSLTASNPRDDHNYNLAFNLLAFGILRNLLTC